MQGNSRESSSFENWLKKDPTYAVVTQSAIAPDHWRSLSVAFKNKYYKHAEDHGTFSVFNNLLSATKKKSVVLTYRVTRFDKEQNIPILSCWILFQETSLDENRTSLVNLAGSSPVQATYCVKPCTKVWYSDWMSWILKDVRSVLESLQNYRFMICSTRWVSDCVKWWGLSRAGCSHWSEELEKGLLSYQSHHFEGCMSPAGSRKSSVNPLTKRKISNGNSRDRYKESNQWGERIRDRACGTKYETYKYSKLVKL